VITGTLHTTSLDDARSQFRRGTGYLAACTGGLPTAGTLAALRDENDSWASGSVSPVRYGTLVDQARASFALLVGVSPERVAIGSQVSAMVAVIAASVPDGAEVLCVEDDFSSMMMPFRMQAHRGVAVRAVALAELAASITASTWLVSYSRVQSLTGALSDDDAVLAAAARHGARTLVDLTQAAGVLPVDASRYDATVTHAYKWLCSPRGVAFTTFSEAFGREVRPTQAAWYAGDDVWGSCYGSSFELAASARRFDVSPAWQAFVGAAPALAFFAGLDMDEVWTHASGLGDSLCDRLGLAPQGQAIVTWHDPSGADLARLEAAGLTVSGRGGRVRVAFHLWNDSDDVDRAASALAGAFQ
jgi:selenocysteine lyase/cysteine desulfurase